MKKIRPLIITPFYFEYFGLNKLECTLLVPDEASTQVKRFFLKMPTTFHLYQMTPP